MWLFPKHSNNFFHVYIFNFDLEDPLLPKPMKKHLTPPPPPDIEIKGTTMKNFPQDKLLDSVKAIYALAKEIADGDGETNVNYLKQRLVEAALTQLNDDNHMIVMAGENVHASFSEPNSRRKRGDDSQPTNYKSENYATRVEWIDFKVIVQSYNLFRGLFFMEKVDRPPF